jgi:hypothetical protein
MPYFLESYPGNKAIVVSTTTGRHGSIAPIPLAKAKAQKRVLEAVMKKKEKP